MWLLQDETHPGMEMMYKYSNKQAEGPDNIVIHAEGQWRLTNNFHDLVFLPQIIVSHLASRLLCLPQFRYFRCAKKIRAHIYCRIMSDTHAPIGLAEQIDICSVCHLKQ